MSLSPEEQMFFETGDASHLQAPPADAPAPAPAPSPLELAALSNEPPAPAPAPAPAATPAPAPAATPAPAPVPADAIEILTSRLQETQRQLAELEAARAKAAPPPPAEPPAPDPAVDPLGALMHKLEALQKQVQTVSESYKQTTEQSQAQANFQAFQQQVVGLRDQFVKTTPDFPDAYNHIRNARAADLASFGFNQQQINETLLREEIALSEKAIREAKNPAAELYEMAKRHGYTPKSAPAPAPAGPTAAEIARAQAAGRQVAAAPAVTEAELTAEGLRQASEADLNKLVMNDATWRKLTGADEYPL